MQRTNVPWHDMGEHHDHATIHVAIVMIILSTAAIVLRFLSRFRLPETRVWWDDWTAFAAWIFSTVICALYIYWTHLGFGTNIDITSIPRHQLTSLGKVAYAISLLYNFGITLVKISVLLLYYRIFKNTRHCKLALLIIGGTIAVWLLTFELIDIFKCSPIHRFWTVNLTKGHCLSEKAILLGNTITNTVTDLVFLIIPLPPLLRLGVVARKNIGVVFTFMLSYLVLVVSILRIASIAEHQPNDEFYLTASSFYPQVLLMVQTPIALVCVCIPAILQLFRRNNLRRGSVVNSSQSIKKDVAPGDDYSIKPCTTNLDTSSSKETTLQVGVLGNVITKCERVDERHITSDSTAIRDGEMSQSDPTSHNLGQEIVHRLSVIANPLNWTALQRHRSNETEANPPQKTPYNLFSPGGCQETYEAVVSTPEDRPSFSVPPGYKCDHDKTRSERLNDRFLSAHGPRSHDDGSVDLETGIRWDEEIKVSQTIDIEYERRPSSQVSQNSPPNSSAIPREIAPF